MLLMNTKGYKYTLYIGLQVSYKAWHVSKSCFLVFTQKELKTMPTQKPADRYLWQNHNHLNLEAAKLSFSMRTEKLMVVYADNKIVFSTNNKLSNHEKAWSNLKCKLLDERSQSEKLISAISFQLYKILEK